MKPGNPPLRSTRLLDQMRERIRYLHYSLSTEKIYLYWVKFFIRWHGRDSAMRHPRSTALRLAAATVRSSKSALGAYFRRMSARMDKPKAVAAAAHKLARLSYTMLTKGEEYTDQAQDYYEERYRERVLRQRSDH